MSKTLTLLLAAALLSGCAALNRLPNEVSSFGSWPAERRPGPFVFERLPSQAAHPESQQLLEDAARPALEAAGFTHAADAAGAAYSVQLAARVTGDDRWTDAPAWGPWGWRGLYGHPRWGLGFGYHGRFGPGGFATPLYEREVTVLIRDRRSGQPVYETRASNTGGSSAIVSLLPAMFEAAMKDFPATGINPRRVTTQITP